MSTTDTTTAWAHLPNAQHIDRVLADVAARPQVWELAVKQCITFDRRTAEHVASSACHRIGGGKITEQLARWALSHIGSTAPSIRISAIVVAKEAAVALVAWDDCAHILDMPPDACRVLAELGNHAAVLLLPAVLAFNGVQS